MFNFKYLDKDEKSKYLPILFDILFSNMKEIVPDEFEKSEFVKEVSTALEKEPRQIILCYNDEELLGFLMFYTRENMIMIEELQLIKKYQMTRAFYLMCKYMIDILPENIERIEAFAHKENVTSISLQKSLGMKIIGEENENLMHLCGDVKTFKNKIR